MVVAGPGLADAHNRQRRRTVGHQAQRNWSRPEALFLQGSQEFLAGTKLALTARRIGSAEAAGRANGTGLRMLTS
jgi:hypothetical protein